MENNMEKVVDLKERAEENANNRSDGTHYILDVRMLKERLDIFLDGVDKEIADGNGITVIPQDVVNDIMKASRDLYDDETLKYLQIGLAEIFGLDPETTITEMFGIFKDEA